MLTPNVPAAATEIVVGQDDQLDAAIDVSSSAWIYDDNRDMGS
jgi:hypothetical protein